MNRQTQILSSICIVISAMLFALMAALINLANRQGIPISQVLIVRTVIMGGTSAAYLNLQQHSLLGPKEVRWWIFIRGIVGGLTVFAVWDSVILLNTGDALTLASTFPVISAIGGYVFFNEKIGWKSAVATCLTVIGATLICRPGFIFSSQNSEENHHSAATLGVVYALCGSLLIATDLLIVKRLRDCKPSQLIFAYAFGCGLIGIILAIISQGWVFWPSYSQLELMIATAIAGTFGQIFIVVGSQNVNVGFGAVLKSSETIFGYVFQVVILAEPAPDLVITIGVALVISAVILSSIESANKQNFKYSTIIGSGLNRPINTSYVNPTQSIKNDLTMSGSMNASPKKCSQLRKDDLTDKFDEEVVFSEGSRE